LIGQITTWGTFQGTFDGLLGLSRPTISGSIGDQYTGTESVTWRWFARTYATKPYALG